MASEKTRIGIIGAGAIGCAVGGLLARAGHDVTLADPWSEHLERIKAAPVGALRPDLRNLDPLVRLLP